MSRIGNLPIPVPSGVDVKITDGLITIKGPKGQLQQDIMPGIVVKLEGDNIVISLDENTFEDAAFQGLFRSLVANMVKGVTEGFQKSLEMIGVGYRAAVQGNTVKLQVGYSHPTELQIPEGIQVSVEKNTIVTVSGTDKQKVGQFAADIRAKRPPEPYQGKGVRYQGEYVRRKAGKAAAKK